MWPEMGDPSSKSKVGDLPFVLCSVYLPSTVFPAETFRTLPPSAFRSYAQILIFIFEFPAADGRSR